MALHQNMYLKLNRERLSRSTGCGSLGDFGGCRYRAFDTTFASYRSFLIFHNNKAGRFVRGIFAVEQGLVRAGIDRWLQSKGL